MNQRTATHQRLDGACQRRDFDGLGEMKVKSGRQGLPPPVVARVGRNGGGGYRGNPPGCRRAHFSNQRIAVFIRHGDVGKEHVHLGTFEDGRLWDD